MRPEGWTIPALLAAQARRRPRAPAVGALDRRPLSYAGLARHVDGIVRRLNRLGLGRGDRVALVLPEGPDLAVACLGVAAGAIAAPLNPRCREGELDACFSMLGVRAVIVQDGLDAPARLVARTRGLALLELTPRTDAAAGVFELRGRREQSRKDSGPAGPDETAWLLQTSGTTGAPKLVPLTHGQLCAAARRVVATLDLTPRDRCLNVMPLFHVHGLVGALLASLAAGASVICAPGFSALRFSTWLEQVCPTWYTAVPAIHQAILRVGASRGVLEAASRPLRLIRSCSAPLPPRLMAELERVFGVPVIEAYGMTEAAHQVTSNPLPPRRRRPGSVGMPVGVEVAVLDPADRPLGPDRSGEVAIRGHTVSRALDGSDSAESAGTGEWVRTGDEGFLDGDGYLFLTGRLSEAVNRGGEKVSPREVDAVLLEHPAVAEAVTVPVPDPDLGEDVAAVVVLREGAGAGAQEIRAFVGERLAPFKVPRQVLLVSELPREATGKVSRRRLAERLGLGAGAPGTPDPPPPAGENGIERAGEGAVFRERLVAFVMKHLEERRGSGLFEVADDTSLLRSGLFDSLALVELAAWIERETGSTLSPVETGLLADCDTVGDILAFVAARRSGAVAGPMPGARPRATASAFPEYRFAAYAPEFKDGIVALQSHLWRGNPSVNAACFQWKYEQNPYASEPLIYVALLGDRIVGMRGFYGTCWEIGRPPEPFPALGAVDLVVAPEHRSRGVLRGIMMLAHSDLAQRGYRHLFNLSAGSATYLGSLSMGWRTTGPLGLLRRRGHRPDGPHEGGADRLPFSPLDEHGKDNGSAGGAVSLGRTPRAGAMAEVVARVRRDARLRHVRDERYFAWRFLNPLSDYRFLFWDDGRLEGYLVLQTPAHRPSPRVNVIDWEGTSSRVRAGLLEAAIEWGAFPDLRVWAVSWAEERRRLLRKFGFRPLGNPSGLGPSHASTVLVSVLGGEASDATPWTLSGRPLLDLATWDLRMVYSDAF